MSHSSRFYFIDLEESRVSSVALVMYSEPNTVWANNRGPVSTQKSSEAAQKTW